MACRIPREIKIALILVLGILSWDCTDNSMKECQNDCLTEKELSGIQSGDIILRLGEGLISQVVTSVLNDSIRLSHCGIVVIRNDSFCVIHSLPKELSDYDGIQICTLGEFVSESVPKSIVIVRPKVADSRMMETKALYYLLHPKPFDWNFDVNDSTAFFCSELPLHILKFHLGMDLCLPINIYPKFSQFLDTTHFEQIYIKGFIQSK